MRLAVDWVNPSWRAARVRLPSRAVATKASIFWMRASIRHPHDMPAPHLARDGARHGAEESMPWCRNVTARAKGIAQEKSRGHAPPASRAWSG